MVPGGVVDHRERLDLSRRFPVEREGPVRSDAGLLTGPHLRVAVWAERFDRGAFLELEVEIHAEVVDPQSPWQRVESVAAEAPGDELDLAPPREQPGALSLYRAVA